MGDIVDLDKFRQLKEAEAHEEEQLEELKHALAELTQEPDFINAGYTGIYIPLEEMVKHSERKEYPEPPVVTRLELLQAAFGHLLDALCPWRKR
mgnify:FL=1